MCVGGGGEAISATKQVPGVTNLVTGLVTGGQFISSIFHTSPGQLVLFL